MPDQPIWQTIAADHPALPGHFPGNAIVPGVVLLSRVWDAVCQAAGTPLNCTGWPSVKFLAPLQPGVPFRVEVEFGAAGSARFACKTAAATIAQGSVRFTPQAFSPSSLPEGAPAGSVPAGIGSKAAQSGEKRDEVSLREFQIRNEA